MTRAALPLIVALALARPAAQAPVAIALPAPWGPHTPAVTSARALIDPARDDAHRAGEKRAIVVRVWYPSDATSGTARPYMPAPVADAWRRTMPAVQGFETAVSTHAIVEAALSHARERWPVLLFSHGRSFPVENYQIALEQLASLGWIVAAISHPYEEAATLLPDGTVLPFDGPRWKDDSARGAVLSGVVDDLARDASIVLDWLESADRDAGSLFSGRLDLARGVGYFGHSLGGAAAAATAQRDTRVAAAASWEGQVYLAEDRPLRVRVPLLYIIAGANKADFAGTQYRPAPGKGPVFELVINGAWHLSFGDMLYIYRHYAPADWHARHRREMHPLRANQITTEYLHEFFGHYLQGEAFDLLWPDSAEELGSYETWNYPEVELRVYGG